MNITEDEFEDTVEHLRDPEIWRKDSKGCWNVKDNVVNHIYDDGVDKVRVPQGERTNFLNKAKKSDKKSPAKDKKTGAPEKAEKKSPEKAKKPSTAKKTKAKTAAKKKDGQSDIPKDAKTVEKRSGKENSDK